MDFTNPANLPNPLSSLNPMSPISIWGDDGSKTTTTVEAAPKAVEAVTRAAETAVASGDPVGWGPILIMAAIVTFGILMLLSIRKG